MALKGEISNRRRIYCGAAEQIKMVLGHILRMMKIGLKNAQLVGFRGQTNWKTEETLERSCRREPGIKVSVNFIITVHCY